MLMVRLRHKFQLNAESNINGPQEVTWEATT